MQDPTLELFELTLEDKTYKLCFDLEALADAEAAMIAAGIPGVNLLHALNLSTANLQGMRSLFAAALRKYQPKMTVKEAMALVTTRNFYDVWNAVIAAWEKAVGMDAEAKGEGQTDAPLEVAEEPSPAPSAG